MEVKKGPKYDEITKLLKEETDGYCPCKLDRTEDTKCICKEFRDQMEKNEKGKCHCQRYEIV